MNFAVSQFDFHLQLHTGQQSKEGRSHQIRVIESVDLSESISVLNERKLNLVCTVRAGRP